MHIIIRQVTEPEELLAVYRLRYATYVEELGYPQKWADHEARTVAEPLDATGHILGAFNEAGAVVGTVRNNYGCESDFGEYAEFYNMKQFGPYSPARLAITTKLILAPEYRRGTLTRLGGLEGENHYFRRGDALKPLVFRQLVAPKGL